MPQWDAARCQRWWGQEGTKRGCGEEEQKGKAPGLEHSGASAGREQMSQRGPKMLGQGELASKCSPPTSERWRTQDMELQHTLRQMSKADMIYAHHPDFKTARWQNPCYIKHAQDARFQLLLCKDFPLWHSPNLVLLPQDTVMFAITAISCISLLSSHCMSHQHLI